MCLVVDAIEKVFGFNPFQPNSDKPLRPPIQEASIDTKAATIPRISLGELEQSVLLAIIRLGQNAYGVKIQEEVAKARPISVGAIYTVLGRLENKKFISSYLGDPSPERGGRAKRHFRVEESGLKALQRSKELLGSIWNDFDESALPSTAHLGIQLK